ncbi:peptidoglycan DD-metalloendopeptidase family protein [Sinanaerobacter sp. ZZT-01]|uniref:peptidoglycan DD-metalloendopeptidase family protein n=1 Tax=Sinanaerobacter sp. ZZT-01 TaxID=3111540 RepID=UPI002D78A1BC|nr:peptidoglycan DD-metalloendopeptidase family protein [Sinanaerobacter sp. ZZT-01]WRR92086.1 peptidoglycan DD-metalloendopeptidase family protein [Sinanaerobacter sp. ZZT-01]
MRQRRKKILAMLLAAVMLAGTSLTAFATDWSTYQGNEKHNGILVEGAETSTSPSVTQIVLPHNGSGWDGVDSAAVMETTEDGDTYAYVLYDGYTIKEDGSGGGRLAKIDCTASTPYVVWDTQITQSPGFQLSSPYLDVEDRSIYVGASGYNQKATNDNLALEAGVTKDWTVSKAGTKMELNKVIVSGDETVTMTQSNVNLKNRKKHRAATGVKVYGSNVAMTITAKLNGTVVGENTFTSPDLIDGHYYLNKNFDDHSSAAEAAVVTGANTLEFTYEVSGNTGNTVEVEYCSLYEQNSAITKLVDIDEDMPTTDWSLAVPNNAQVNTPIVKNEEYIYFGTWSGRTGTYYQYDIDCEELLEYNPGNGGFYWAGAVVDGDYVYFGGDNGYLYARPVGDDFEDPDEGSIINLETAGGVSPGNVRSTISLVDGHLYFTSQGGYIWSFTPNDGMPTLDWKAELAATSTSTPTVVGNDIYVGYYAGFSAGGVQKIEKTGRHTVTTIATPGPVQSSVLVYMDGGVNYLYFTTNSATGAGYCYNGSTRTKVWQTRGDTYTLQGMASSNGILTFGNDYDHFYLVGGAHMTEKIPDHTGAFVWPADSAEVTLWFGEVDEQYTAANQGMNIQGEANGSVYSVSDGVVAYKGNSSKYENVLYINFKYNGIYMQARYGHLSETASLRVGDKVKKGDFVGKMATDSDTGSGLVEIVLCKSSNGVVCNKNGSNIQFVDPIQYLERPMCDISYLEQDMATVLDTSGLQESSIATHAIWPWEDANDPDIRYRENKDLNTSQAYLRKLIVEYGREVNKAITHKNIVKKGVISYNAADGITTIKLNGRTKKYGVSLGNAKIKNNRMVVDREQVWYDLIGNVYHYPEGGTWYAEKTDYISGGVWQVIYMPKDIANDLYRLTGDEPIPQMLYDRGKEAMVGIETKAFAEFLSANYGIEISASNVGVFAAALVFLYDFSKAYDRNKFFNAIEQCNKNEFVRISCFLIPYQGITYSYTNAREIKDVYRSTGVFKAGYFEFSE